MMNSAPEENQEEKMALTLKELRDMNDDDLVSAHDHKADNVVLSLNDYLNEINRRSQSKQTKQMLNYTWWITIL
ncbi:MAG: hypothetical protein H8D23_27710 [Candidatus Brocadiales bacterium]|nr:hypothetical protein [Candidatus Brocadiales bacterium]